jgi:hypothetical protein
MKKIVFFTENKWAFGNIHHALSKLLFPHGFDCELLDFFTKYEPDEMRQIDQNTHMFVTTPPGAVWLLGYGIDPSKIRATAHGQWDILLAQRQMGLNFESLGGYSVVSSILHTKSAEFGVQRTPLLTPVGIFFDRFYRTPAAGLAQVGYAAAWESKNFWGQEIKRGRLVQAAAQQAQLPLTVCNRYHYLAMAGFYDRVGCVVMSSVEEGAGLPMLEAAAAGRLCVGTPVGYFAQHSDLGGGLAVSLDETEFVEQTASILQHYAANSSLYVKKCLEIQEHAKYAYDWKYHINSWVEFLSN